MKDESKKDLKTLLSGRINERVSIKTVKNGLSAEDLLQEYYSKFGEGTWKNGDIKDVKIKFTPKHYLAFFLLLKGMDYLSVNPGRYYQITPAGLNYIKKNNLDVGADAADDSDTDSGSSSTGLAKGVRDISNIKIKKFNVPKLGNNSQYLKKLVKILNHMEGFANGEVKTGFMLGGEPGTGKTSMIKSLATLTGLPLVVIEAPHIVQEHLINIPFLVLDGDKKFEGNVSVEKETSKNPMKVVHAESNLITQLGSKKMKSPERVQKEINKNKTLRDIYPQVKGELDSIKGSYKSILFLDEFYRTSSTKIKNVLRGILDGKIGNDKIPKGVYIIMATNTKGEGVDDIELNQDFHLLDNDISSKEDFMTYMYGKYVNNPDDENVMPTDDDSGETVVGTPTGIEIKPEVWNKFMENLNDKDLGFEDNVAEVRLSPRRLEQILIYVDASIPVGSAKDAKNLIAFIRYNLSNYTNEMGSDALIGKFQNIVGDLLKETLPEGLDIDVDFLLNSPTKKSEWREHLQHEIEMKIKLGESRSYIPIVAGQPGIGKTTQMGKMAADLEMGFIQINTAILEPENISGMPIANMPGDRQQYDDNGQEIDDDGKIRTEFSESSLYMLIMESYDELIGKFKQPDRKYNIVLLFDELNRTSVPVFNAIRKVLLEKEVGNKKLPPDILITGAINPALTEGTIEFTSHTRDVMDIISSAGSFKNTYKFIRDSEQLIAISTKIGFPLHMGVLDLMAELANSFRSPVDNDEIPLNDTEQEPFYWNDGEFKFYVSAREMTQAVSNACVQVRGSLRRMNYSSENEYTEEQYDALIDEVITSVADSFNDSIGFTTTKQDMTGFLKKLYNKITMDSKFRRYFEAIRTPKSKNTLNLVQVMNNYEGDVVGLSKSTVGNYMKEFTSTEMNQDITTITENFMVDLPIAEALAKICDVHAKLKKVFASLDGVYVESVNSYMDKIDKHLGPKVLAILRSDTVDILDILSDEKLMKKIEGFVSE
jgi:broad-specificity NMP kinase